MPEGPELRASADHLSRVLVGRRIINAFPNQEGRYWTSPPVGWETFMDRLREAPHLVDAIDVKGKFMWWQLSAPSTNEQWFLWTTYGMSGRWCDDAVNHRAFTVYHANLNKQSESAHEWHYDVLHFHDPRRFGTLRFVAGRAALERKLATLGPDMLKASTTSETFIDRVRARMARGWTIARALMDQSCVSGVGNYVKAETLYAARISPHRLLSDLGDDELRSLHAHAQRIMLSAYMARGASLRNYRQPDGSTGGAQHQLLVYGRSSDPEGRRVITEATTDGRTTWWCPEVQR